MQPEKWITKPEAAEILKLSNRALERIVAKGLIEKKLLPRQGNEPARAVYRHESVIQIRDQRAAGITPAAVVPARQFDPRGVDGPGVRLADIFATSTNPNLQHVAAVMAQIDAHHIDAHQTEKPKLWLTPKEAAAQSGLPRRFLCRLCLDGKIGCNVGTAKHPKFRIHSDELGRSLITAAK